MGPVEGAPEEAFTCVYADCYWPLVRFAARRVGDLEAARDVVADTFAIAWRRWDDVPSDRPLPWLYRVAGNLLANEYRRQVREADLRQRLFERGPSTQAVADRLEWSDRLRSVVAGLYSLSDSDQEVLRLHAWEGLHRKDLARALGCSTAAAAVRLHRARRRLRDLLTEVDSEGFPSFLPSAVEPDWTRSRTQKRALS